MITNLLDFAWQIRWLSAARDEPYDRQEKRVRDYALTLTTDEKRGERPLDPTAQVFRADKVRDSGKLPDKDFAFDFEGETLTPGSNHSWRGRQDEMRRLKGAERLLRTDQTLAFKFLLSDSGGVELTSLWEDTAGKIPSMIYVVQTNTKLLERCLLMTTDPGDIVFDPTCGSGTSAYSSEQWGRRWITCDTSRVALSLARQRLMTARFPYYQLRELSADDTKRNPDGTWLSDPAGQVPGKVTFKCNTVPNLTLKGIARNTSLDPILSKHELVLSGYLKTLNALLASVTSDLRARLAAKLAEKQKHGGQASVTEADRRRWVIPKAGWSEWEVPFDTDPDWPKPLQETVTAYRVAWRAKMDEVNACIVANAQLEEMIDKPEELAGVVRVSGPFTVEGVRPEEVSLGGGGLFDATPNEFEPDAAQAGSSAGNLQAYLSQMVQHLRADGVTFLGNQQRRFMRVEALFEEASGSLIHAEGTWEGADANDLNTVGVSFGPQFGPVTAEQVEEAIRAARQYEELVLAGFSFDAEASAVVAEQSHPRLRIHAAMIRPDLNQAMDGLLKDTPNSQLFTVFGQPEIEVEETKDGWICTLTGVDIYNPVENTVLSSGADKVAAWFLDSDFDGRCFCITQAFFPDQNAWGKIAKALGSSADPEAFEAFKGTKSLPFPKGKYARIAVKVIDPRGNEVMVVRKLS